MGNGMSLGIYIHVPYCIRKCRYCDFVSFEKAPEDAYFEKLARNIRSAKNAVDDGMQYYVDTLFFGGGTPSLASSAQLEKVLDAVRDSFDISDKAEITIEANPETVTREKAAELKELGFTRVSMGVQSFDDAVLKALGRVHSADRARQALGTLRDAGFDNINLDLMFGVPMQSLDIWKQTLDEALSLRPEHLSFYSLQLEDGTPLWSDYRNGRADLPSWEENRAMYHFAVKTIRQAGYHHYEVSNAALPGCECRHNLKYWTMQPYLGFGTSAHSFTGLCRGEADWDRGPDPADGSVFGLQLQSPEDLKGDFIFTQLRLTCGLDVNEYSSRFGSSFEEEYSDELRELSEEGMTETVCGEGSWGPSKLLRLTEKGLDNTNNVMERLLLCIRPQ